MDDLAVDRAADARRETTIALECGCSAMHANDALGNTIELKSIDAGSNHRADATKRELGEGARRLHLLNLCWGLDDDHRPRSSLTSA